MGELEVLIKEHERLNRRIDSLHQTGQIINFSGAALFALAAVLGGTADEGVKIAAAVVLPIIWSGLVFYSQVLRWDRATTREYVRALELRINECARTNVTGWELLIGQPAKRDHAYRYFFWYWLALSCLVWLASIGFLWRTALGNPVVYWFVCFQIIAAVVLGVGVVRTLRWREEARMESRRRSLEFFGIQRSATGSGGSRS